MMKFKEKTNQKRIRSILQPVKYNGDILIKTLIIILCKKFLLIYIQNKFILKVNHFIEFHQFYFQNHLKHVIETAYFISTSYKCLANLSFSLSNPSNPTEAIMFV